MKTIVLLLSLTAMFSLFSCSTKVEQPTVTQLDPTRYAGEWHEIGRLPNRFEKDVVAAKATYGAQEDGSFSVKNEGLKSDGKETEILGSATQPDPAQPGRLKVRFNPFPANLFAGDYWILALSQDYTRAMVGSPGQNYLWFLSKHKDSQKENFADFLKTAEELGYDSSQVFWNPKRISN